MSTEHPTPYPIDEIEDALEVLKPDWADKLAAARKSLVAGAGAVGQLVEAGVLHGTVLHYAQVVLGAATAIGVYATRNVDPPVPALNDIVADAPPPSDRTPDQGPDGEHLAEHAAGD